MSDLHLDLGYGLGGDMLLAGLIGLGLDPTPLAQAITAAGVAVELGAWQDSRRSGMGWRLMIEAPGAQPMRHLPQLTDIVTATVLSENVKSYSIEALTELGKAEAAVHEVPLEEIHFHEVGAVDTLVDVLGAFWALEALDVTRVQATTVPWFTGFVDCEHGRLPLPAPATRKLLEGLPTHDTAFEQEMITPTGALLIRQVVDEFDEPAPGEFLRRSLAYGDRDTGGGLVLTLAGR